MLEMYYQYLYLQYLQHLLSQAHQPQQDLQDHQEPPVQVADRQEDREEEEEEVGGDLLEWLYQFSRLAILLSIVYLYSSLSRILIVLGLAGLIYLHQVGHK